MSVDKKEEIRSRFLNDLEQYVEYFDAPDSPKETFPFITFIKRDGTEINFSLAEAFKGGKNDDLKKLLGRLYPYYDNRRELPLSAWGYLFNEENPKQPIFWPPDMEYFQQFLRLLNKLGYIGQFRKTEKQAGETQKVESVGKKLITIKPAFENKSHPAV